MRVGIATVQVPFVRGGAEMHADSLAAEIRKAGHEAEIIAIPFRNYPAKLIPEHMLACGLLNVEESYGVVIDRLVALKFPAYLLRHSHKVLWLLHQHREAYDLWDSPVGGLKADPDGAQVRAIIHHADEQALSECAAVYANSKNVSARLLRWCGISSTPLYHPPPQADLFAPGEDGDYLLLPSRIDRSKRQLLIIEALRLTRTPVRLVVMGAADDRAYMATLTRASEEAGLGSRIHWVGRVDDVERRRLYGDCLAVAFVPVDEDYGYVTLEAMLAGKPVITCTDSGGPLEFVIDAVTGFVRPPAATALAEAIDTLWRDRAKARAMGRAGLDRYHGMGLSWDDVLSKLLA